MAATKPRDLTPAGTWVGTTLSNLWLCTGTAARRLDQNSQRNNNWKARNTLSDLVQAQQDPYKGNLKKYLHEYGTSQSEKNDVLKFSNTTIPSSFSHLLHFAGSDGTPAWYRS